MAYNPQMYIPQAYQPMYQPMMQPAQTPTIAPQVQGTQMSFANQPQQMLTPPTIRAEIIQIDDEAAVDRFPLGAGQSQMFMTKAEDKIIIKTMGQNGPLPLDVYEKRPPQPKEPPFNPADYVRRDEINALVAAAVASQPVISATPRKRSNVKEVAEGEPV